MRPVDFASISLSKPPLPGGFFVHPFRLRATPLKGPF